MQRRTWALQAWWSPRTWPGRGRCSGCRGSGWNARARCGAGVQEGPGALPRGIPSLLSQALQAPPQKPPLCRSQGLHHGRQSRDQEPCPPHLQNGIITALKLHDVFVRRIRGVPIHKVLSAVVTLGPRSPTVHQVSKYSCTHSNLFSPWPPTLTIC